MSIPVCAPARPLSRAPKKRLPAGTVDCHFHVFGPERAWPYAPGRSYTPPDATLADYETLADSFGIARSVIIQPSPYGMDNRRSLQAIAESRLPMRAVLVVEPDVSDHDLAEFHRLGARGVRLNLLFGAGLALETAQTLAKRIQGLDWHLQFLADVSTLTDLTGFVERLRVPAVFDHLGHVPAHKGIRDAGFQNLLALVRDGLAWVKLSGTYRSTGLHATPYVDTRPFIDALIDANARQLVWGTDWPHPAIAVPMPDDTELVDQFNEWVDDTAVRQAIFVDNPERLYGFEPYSS
ncbi:amidohydrolase family protein [Paraburkholderia rhizosphaerae]|uniref:Putative TIM-barrel fold metal-dependent hydrolase n=1 Tax=Paraburkholderia rhizosphaerae TaxID=480658 RepID=A0A4R8LTP3_9BURK|nr:amidohydrolase family protein [Paraburkholderia rhizosphaerae]TDY50888.1 putative TIM-barrel fold metal-dependent hydrolase [Paraburkholderia rhizosphaerae]